MSSNKSGAIGTRAETATVRALLVLGFPHAERRRLKGRLDEGDITGTPNLCWSVKGGHQAWNASDLDILRWLAELETQRTNAGAELGILVTQRKGVGHENAHRWWAWMWNHRLAELLMPDAPHPLGYDDIPVRLPCRLLLADMCTLLRFAGFGEPFPSPSKEGTQ